MPRPIHQKKSEQESHFEDETSALQNDLKSLKKDIFQLRTDLSQLAQGYANKGKDKVRMIRDDVVHTGEKAKQSVEDNIAKHPVTSMAIALTVGLLIGGISRLRSSYKNKEK